MQKAVSRKQRIQSAFNRLLPSAFRMPARERGFTLLLAALVATIVLALGSSIFSIAQKQVTLSSIGRDSQFAFYAADNGAECALYWDIRYSTFATSTDSGPMLSITCDSVTVTPTLVSANAESAASSFQIDLFTRDSDGNLQQGYCTQVSVEKNPTLPYTVIHSDGYSTSCADITTSARALQRSVELNY